MSTNAPDCLPSAKDEPTRSSKFVPPVFAAKSPLRIMDEMRGFPPSAVEAALRYRDDGLFETFIGLLPGMVEFHLPRGSAMPPAVLDDGLRLNQDLGLDSLALTEMAFKLDDMFGVPIETREVFGVETVADLKAFLRSKFNLQ